MFQYQPLELMGAKRILEYHQTGQGSVSGFPYREKGFSFFVSTEWTFIRQQELPDSLNSGQGSNSSELSIPSVTIEHRSMTRHLKHTIYGNLYCCMSCYYYCCCYCCCYWLWAILFHRSKLL